MSTSCLKAVKLRYINFAAIFVEIVQKKKGKVRKVIFCKQLSLVLDKLGSKLGQRTMYKNGHKNVFGLSIVLELKVENSTFLTFKVIFLCQKLSKSLSFFSSKNIKKESNFYSCHIFNVFCYQRGHLQF